MGIQRPARIVTHVGADGGRSHGGKWGRLMETEPVEVKPRMETDNHRARVTPRIRKAKAKLKA